MTVIDAWVEPGTTAISDCGGDYTHRTVNHNIGFVDQRTSAHTNTIESAWCHVKAFLSPYNRKGEYIHHLVHYMFAPRCRAEKVNQFTQVLRLVATIDWTECLTPSESSFVCHPSSLRLQPQVKAYAGSNDSCRVEFWETCVPFGNDRSATLGRLLHGCTLFPSSSSTYLQVIRANLRA